MGIRLIRLQAYFIVPLLKLYMDPIEGFPCRASISRTPSVHRGRGWNKYTFTEVNVERSSENPLIVVISRGARHECPLTVVVSRGTLRVGPLIVVISRAALQESPLTVVVSRGTLQEQWWTRLSVW